MGKAGMVFEVGKEYANVEILEINKQQRMADWTYRHRCLRCGTESVITHRSLVDRVRIEREHCSHCNKRTDLKMDQELKMRKVRRVEGKHARLEKMRKTKEEAHRIIAEQARKRNTDWFGLWAKMV